MCGEQSRVSHTPLYSRDFSIFVNSIRFVSAHCLHPLPSVSSPSILSTLSHTRYWNFGLRFPRSCGQKATPPQRQMLQTIVKLNMLNVLVRSF